MVKFKSIKLRWVLVLIVIVGVGYCLFPVKFAVSEKNIDTSRRYIIARRSQGTYLDFTVLEDSGSSETDCIYVSGDWDKIKEVSTGYPSYFLNKYVIYTEDDYVVREGIDDILYLENYDIDVLYPIKREDFNFILPNWWICRFETWDIFK